MKIHINFNNVDFGGTGECAYNFLHNFHKDQLNIIFTKGKLELDTKDIEKINVYTSSMNIILNDKTTYFVNLETITQMY